MAQQRMKSAQHTTVAYYIYKHITEHWFVMGIKIRAFLLLQTFVFSIHYSVPKCRFAQACRQPQPTRKINSNSATREAKQREETTVLKTWSIQQRPQLYQHRTEIHNYNSLCSMCAYIGKYRSGLLFYLIKLDYLETIYFRIVFFLCQPFWDIYTLYKNSLASICINDKLSNWFDIEVLKKKCTVDVIVLLKRGIKFSLLLYLLI